MANPASRPAEKLPPIQEIDPDIAPLMVDRYLSRFQTGDRVCEALGVERDDPGGRNLSHDTLRRLTAAATEDRSAGGDKTELIHRLGDVYGFETRRGVTELTKSHHVHILIAEKTGDAPEPFRLSSDRSDA